MDNFINLNGRKIKFAFLTTSSIFLIFSFILFVYSYSKGETPDLASLITGVFVAGFVMPAFIIAVAYYEWYRKKRVRLKAFKIPPFDRLEEMGFHKYYVLENSRFFFTEEVKRGEINDFTLICNVERNSPNKIAFRAIAKDKQLDKSEFKKLEHVLKGNNIELDFGALTKAYNLKKIQFMTISDLNTDLEQFTDLLKENGFEPLKENG
ncbi:hypothetical protein DJ568_12985 [Mucilaginibacter hurinus]|uniref:Uncharacterized protein n=1 Tax=Mucilaginibacter hurinus TaxID=2201324 RepID=A0A367GL75_9SPHI|nr:hypothetical protein [Mucilaginibacter hurinus]RCH54209.1 hypothetical protein DJ568_12985 [Mucilaginibacter hurinus]